MNRATGVWYAVKMIKDKRTPQQQLEQPGGIRSAAVVREISIMEKLKHPNICELKEVFTEEGSSDISTSRFRLFLDPALTDIFQILY